MEVSIALVKTLLDSVEKVISNTLKQVHSSIDHRQFLRNHNHGDADAILSTTEYRREVTSELPATRQRCYLYVYSQIEGKKTTH